MSILIKGMEMPTDHPLWIVVHSDGTVEANEVSASRPVGWQTLRNAAVPVPSHGDLIDLKAPFKAQYYDEMTEEWLEKTVTVEDALYGCMVDEMPPTIIPAEEGE